MRLKGSADSVNELAFSPNDDRVATGGFDGTLSLYDARTGDLIRTFGRPVDEISGVFVGFDAQGETVARFGDDRRLEVWPAGGGEPLRAQRLAGGSVWEASLSPGLDWLVVVERSGAIQLWDVGTARGGRLQTNGVAASDAVFSRDGSRLAVLAQDGTVTIWDVEARRPLGRPLRSPADTISVAFSGDGDTLATGGDGLITLWTAAAEGPLVRPLSRDTGSLFGGADSVAAAPDGGTVAWGEGDEVVLRRNGRPPQDAPPADFSDFFLVQDLAFSPGGTTLAIISDVGFATWKLGEAKLEGPFEPETEGEQIASSPEWTIAIADARGHIRLWDAQHGTPVGNAVAGDETNLIALASSPSGDLLASAGYGEVIDIWRVAGGEGSGRRLQRHDRPLKGHTGAVLTVAFSPAGDRLASGGNDGEIRLWDVDSRRQLGEPLPAHAGGVNDLAFAGDGRTLFSAGEFPRLRPGTEPGAPGAELPSLAGADWTVAEWDALLWSAERKAVKRRLCAIASRNLRPSEWAQFLPGKEAQKPASNGQMAGELGRARDRPARESPA